MGRDNLIKDNPALERIAIMDMQQDAEPDPEELPKPPEKKAASKAKKPKKKSPDQLRTRRTQFLLPPALYAELEDAAWESRQSVNETVIQAITAYLKKRRR